MMIIIIIIIIIETITIKPLFQHDNVTLELLACRVVHKIINAKSYDDIQINTIIIHQTFSLARDWSKHVTWANIPQLKLGNIRRYSPIFKTDG